MAKLRPDHRQRMTDKVEKFIDQSSIARTSWLMVDQQTETGTGFGKKMDEHGRLPAK